MSGEKLIRMLDQPERELRVGRCEGNNCFIAIRISTNAHPPVAFVFDAGGYFLRAVSTPSADPAHRPDEQLAHVLAGLEPYAFEDVVEVRPFTCKIGGRTARLTLDRDGARARLKHPGGELTFDVEQSAATKQRGE
jgi:hypothetical protein